MEFSAPPLVPSQSRMAVRATRTIRPSGESSRQERASCEAPATRGMFLVRSQGGKVSFPVPVLFTSDPLVMGETCPRSECTYRKYVQRNPRLFFFFFLSEKVGRPLKSASDQELGLSVPLVLWLHLLGLPAPPPPPPRSKHTLAQISISMAAK